MPGGCRLRTSSTKCLWEQNLPKRLCLCNLFQIQVVTDMRRNIILLLVLVLVVGVAVAIVVVQLQQNKGTTVNGTPVSGTPGPTTPTATISVAGIPHAQGSQLVDAAGHPFLLRGAQIESPFNYIKRWEKGQSPFDELNPTVFNAMVHGWHMNALRLPISPS